MTDLSTLDLDTYVVVGPDAAVRLGDMNLERIRARCAHVATDPDIDELDFAYEVTFWANVMHELVPAGSTVREVAGYHLTLNHNDSQGET